MNDLQKFIINKGLEKASLEVIKQAIRQDPSLPNDVKEFWIGVIRGYSISKDVYDLLDYLNRRRYKKFFTSEQIEIMADAVEDHRASDSKPPRTIYGKIVAEADRIIDSTTIMARTIQYGLSNYPALTKKEHIERAVAHIKEKYGEGGYLKLWIPQSDNAARQQEFRALISNEQLLTESLKRIYDEESTGNHA